MDDETEQPGLDSEEEGEEENDEEVAPAYSMTDLTGELDDEDDEELFEDALSENEPAVTQSQSIEEKSKSAVTQSESPSSSCHVSEHVSGTRNAGANNDEFEEHHEKTENDGRIQEAGSAILANVTCDASTDATEKVNTLNDDKDDQTLPSSEIDRKSVSSESTLENGLDHNNSGDCNDITISSEFSESVCDDSLQCRTLNHDYVNNPDQGTLSNHDYEPISGLSSRQSTFTREQANIYENVDIRGRGYFAGEESADEWGSDEFEPVGEASGSFEEERSSQGSGDIRRHKGSEPPGLPARNKEKKRSSKSGDVQLPARVRHGLARLASRGKKDDSEESGDEDSSLVDFVINMDKHPAPQLGHKPSNLSPIQEKRRMIVSSIVDTENSYLASLRRIVKDYEQALLAADPKIIRKRDVRSIFFKVKDILQCHNMFQIELSATIQVWDQEEKIGCVFNGSFSKSMVFEAYSAFVNNFSVAMETAKKQMSSKPAFAEFLKQKLMNSPDKLSLFGLMVKPVQRFPQFILLLQDLLKHTPHDHHDRRDLQMALTELETLTHKLNDTKRESESRHEVNRIIANLAGKSPVKKDDERFLIRKDDMVMTYTMNGETKSKTRRLILLNDQLLCVSSHLKDTEAMSTEKYKLKWIIPIQQVTVEESTFNSTTKSSGKVNGQKFEPPDSPPPDHPHKKDLDDLLHDIPIIDQVRQLVTSLRFKYQTLTLESLQGISRHLQLLVRQKTDIDQCTIRLSLPTRQTLTSTDKLRDDVSRHIKQASSMKKPSLERPRNSRSVYTFQVPAPSLKQDWLLEFRNAKLALEPSNRPGWHLPEGMTHFLYKQPLFIKTLPVDITNPENKSRRSKKKSKVWIQCATPIMLPSHDQPGLGIQHLWVCSGERGKSHITIVSLHGGEPYAIESFRSGGSVYVCAEMVPGLENDGETFDDTVWIATEDNKIQIFKVIEENRKGPKMTFDTDDVVIFLLYHNNHVYAGHHKGLLIIYSRTLDGSWSNESKQTLRLGTQPVAQLLLVHDQVWAACGNHIHVVQQVKSDADGNKKTCTFKAVAHELGMAEAGSIECMVKAGVGLVVSFRNKDLIRLYHLRTLDFLQDINMTSVIKTFFEGRDINADVKDSMKRLSVTCLQTTKGLLWIGTNVGCVMCLPLPRLEGVPRISGRSSVSFHAHNGPVRFLTALNCGVTALQPPGMSIFTDSRESAADLGHGILRRDSEVVSPKSPASPSQHPVPQPRNRNLIAKSADYTLNEMYPIGDTLKSASTPNLTESYLDDQLEDLRTLYGSLMRGLDMGDTELEDSVKAARNSRVRLSKEIMGRQMGKVKNASEVMMSKIKKQLDMKSSPKAATLPVLHEDGQSLSSTDGETSSQKHSSQASSGDYCPMGPSDSEPGGGSAENIYENTTFHSQQNSNGYMNSEECRSSYIRALSAVVPEGPAEVTGADQAIYPGIHSTSHLHSKAVVMISGGDGHVNWNEPKAESSRYEDICLLLWQCRD